ncbi:uncharacterized protein TrAFT101_001506 [Trichoderma asperellum]|uniref:uncharacterized protein n=1 Tax=Trichoderma asperellum TaxID=101201 RepID=UPI00331A4446|nr:hypothetical protein TrAFT101_001506 [Trichoderma asperellum]
MSRTRSTNRGINHRVDYIVYEKNSLSSNATLLTHKQAINSGIELGAPLVHIRVQGSSKLINRPRLDMPAK